MSRLKLAFELRFRRIPTEWSAQAHTVFPGWNTGKPAQGTEERYAEPSVDQSITRNVAEIDGWAWRRLFLQMKHTEKSALKVLDKIGVWEAVEDHGVSQSKTGKKLVSGAFGSRYFSGRALPVTFDDLWSKQRYWHDLLRNPAELKKRFGPSPPAHSRPIDKLRYAVDTHFLNEFKVHIEWRKGLPTAVVECITGCEALAAITQFEMLQGAKYRICRNRNCGIPFAVTDDREKIYCTTACGHVVAARNNRKKNAEKKKQEARKNGNL